MVTAEFAMTMPVLVLVLYLVISVGKVLIAHIEVTDASREAARGWAMNVTEAEVVTLVRERAGHDADLDVSRQGDLIHVTVRKPVTGMWIPGGMEASSTMTARVEPGR